MKYLKKKKPMNWFLLVVLGGRDSFDLCGFSSCDSGDDHQI